MIDTLYQDLRIAIRTLLARPGYSAAIVFTLALAIGANTTVFSIVNSILLHPLSYADPDRLILAWMQAPKQGLSEFPASEPEYLDYKNQTHAFERMAAFATLAGNLTGIDRPERVQIGYVTANLFPLLGMNAKLGRVFSEVEDQPDNSSVVLLSNGLWRRSFGASKEIIGKSIHLNGKERTVLGVMPAEFRIPDEQTDLWVPLAIDARKPDERTSHYLQIIGKLRQGTTLGQARSEVTALMASWDQNLKGLHHPNATDHPIKLLPLNEYILGNSQRSLFILLGAVSLILLLACANVASLMLARAESRGREMTIRLALGARHRDLLQQLLVESILLALAGGMLGVFISFWGADSLSTLPIGYLPRQSEVSINGTVLLVSGLVAIVTGILCGLAPAWQCSRFHLTENLKEGSPNATAGRNEHRLQKWFVVWEVALALMIVIGAGLLMKSFAKVQAIDPGFRADGVLSFEISLPRSQYSEPHQVGAFYRNLNDSLKTLPGVESVGSVSRLPLSATPPPEDIVIEGKVEEGNGPPHNAELQVISGDYFGTMRIPLIRGRALDQRDELSGAAVTAINQSMAQLFWTGENPIGKRLRLGGMASDSPWLTVVGIVGDVRQSGLLKPARPEIFVFSSQASHFDFLLHTMSFVIRHTSGDESLATAAKLKVWNEDSNLPVYHVAELDQVVLDSIARRRFSVLMMILFAGFAILLAALGIYAVLSFAVTRRKHELGVRMALGAQRLALFRLILQQGMAMTATGLAAGLLGAAVLSRILTSLLFETTPMDPQVFAGVSLFLALVAFLACYLPARKATKTDPIAALKCE